MLHCSTGAYAVNSATECTAVFSRFLAILTRDGTIRIYDSVLATIKTVASFSLFSWLKPLLGPCGRCRRSGTSGSATAAGRHVLAWNPNGEFLASFKG